MQPLPEFRPHPLLRSGHAQTIFAAVCGAGPIPYRALQHTIATTDHDRLVLHDDQPAGWRPGQSLVLLAHGLGGSHSSPYMVRAAHKLSQRGARVFRLDWRGCGAGYRLAGKPGHAGRSEDLAAAAQFVAESCPGSPITLVGFSLGANILLKLLGEWGEQFPTAVRQALAVAPPIDLLACALNIQRPTMTLYNRFFVRGLNRQIADRRGFVPELAAIDPSLRPKTLFEFDDRVTAPLSGFTGAHDYYSRSSSLQRLAAVRVPTLILAAADDPIVPAQMFATARPSANVTICITRHGGHVGFVGSTGIDPDRYWLDWRIVDYVTRN